MPYEITMTPVFERRVRRGDPEPANPANFIGFRVAFDHRKWEECVLGAGVAPCLFSERCRNDLDAFAATQGRPISEDEYRVLLAGPDGDIKKAWTSEEAISFATIVRLWGKTRFNDLLDDWLTNAAAEHADFA